MKTILIVLLTLFIGLPLGGLFMMLMVNYLFTYCADDSLWRQPSWFLEGASPDPIGWFGFP